MIKIELKIFNQEIKKPINKGLKDNKLPKRVCQFSNIVQFQFFKIITILFPQV